MAVVGAPQHQLAAAGECGGGRVPGAAGQPAAGRATAPWGRQTGHDAGQRGARRCPAGRQADGGHPLDGLHQRRHVGGHVLRAVHPVVHVDVMHVVRVRRPGQHPGRAQAARPHQPRQLVHLVGEALADARRHVDGRPEPDARRRRRRGRRATPATGGE